MDWTNSMAVFGFPQQDGDVDDDENEDFYDDGDEQVEQQEEEDGEIEEATLPGASIEQQKQSIPMTPQVPSVDVKAENQRRAEELRAKLLAQRQNTPMKINTPIKSVETPSKVSSIPQPQHTLPPKPSYKSSAEPTSSAQPLIEFDLEGLLSKGKAEADKLIANAAAEAVKATTVSAATNGNNPPQPNHPIDRPRGRADLLSNAYYADLPAWLEVTGYHDIEFRNKRLASYKERKALQAEAARIASRLEELKQMEEEEARMVTPVSRATNMAPPALPSVMPMEMSYTNGTKRAHSPDLLSSVNKRREENAGFRIRGANESPDLRPAGARTRRPNSPSPPRRISYPDSRRRSVDEIVPSRDSSLERRQNYYRTDVPRRDGDRYSSDYRDNEPGPYSRYGSRDTPRGGHSNSRGGRINSQPQQYRGPSFSRPV